MTHRPAVNVYSADQDLDVLKSVGLSLVVHIFF